MLPVLEHPELRALAKRRDEINAAHEKWRQRALEARERFQRDMAEYRTASHDALLSGAEPPPRLDPKLYEIEGHPDVFRRELDALVDEERRVLAAHAAEFRADLDAATGRLYARIRPHVEALVEAASELDKVRVAHRKLDNAVGRPASVWTGDEVTAARLVESILDGSTVTTSLIGAL